MFAILFEVLLIEIQEKIPLFAGWEGGGLRGTKIVNKNFVNKLAFPKVYTTTVETPLFSFFRVRGSMVYTLLSGPMVYTPFPCLVYTIAFFAL